LNSIIFEKSGRSTKNVKPKNNRHNHSLKSFLNKPSQSSWMHGGWGPSSQSYQIVGSYSVENYRFGVLLSNSFKSNVKFGVLSIQLGPHSEILGVLFRRILSFWGPNGFGVLTVMEFFQLCKKFMSSLTFWSIYIFEKFGIINGISLYWRPKISKIDAQ